MLSLLPTYCTGKSCIIITAFSLSVFILSFKVTADIPVPIHSVVWVKRKTVVSIHEIRSLLQLFSV